MRARRAGESGGERQRRRRRKAPAAAAAGVRAGLVGQREHLPANGRGVPLGGSGKGLRHDDPEAAPALTPGADAAQPRIGELTAEPPAHHPLDCRIVRRPGDPDPQRPFGAKPGPKLRLPERLAVRDQARGFIQPAALGERRQGRPRKAAVGRAGPIDRADRVCERGRRPERAQQQRNDRRARRRCSPGAVADGGSRPAGRGAGMGPRIE
jgi:hypothetical protein